MAVVREEVYAQLVDSRAYFKGVLDAVAALPAGSPERSHLGGLTQIVYGCDTLQTSLTRMSPPMDLVTPEPPEE